MWVQTRNARRTLLQDSGFALIILELRCVALARHLVVDRRILRASALPCLFVFGRNCKLLYILSACLIVHGVPTVVPDGFLPWLYRM